MSATVPAIDVVPASLAHIDALLDGDEAFRRRFGWRVVPGYLEFPEALEAARRGLRDGAEASWNSHLFVDPGASELVGFGGFKGPPTDGDVEIGYSVAPTRRGRGIATAAALELIERARAAGVTTVLAHTLPEENASTSVLRHCGMDRAGDSIDADVGEVWRWELPVGEAGFPAGRR